MPVVTLLVLACLALVAQRLYASPLLRHAWLYTAGALVVYWFSTSGGWARGWVAGWAHGRVGAWVGGRVGGWVGGWALVMQLLLLCWGGFNAGWCLIAVG